MNDLLNLLLPVLLALGGQLSAAETEPNIAADDATQRAGRLHQLEIFTDGYPRSFQFWTTTRQMIMEGEVDPARAFQALNGVASPCEYWPTYLAFKKGNPRKLVYLFTQGHVFAEDPCQFDPIDRSLFFAGHWVYFEGCKVTADIAAESGQTVVPVADPGSFHMMPPKRPGWRETPEDVVLTRLDALGRPDWHAAEQVRLVSVDPEAKTITVERGCYGTKPLAFQGGRAYAASHAWWDWGSNGGISWTANYSPQCPRDKQGRSAADLLLERFSGLFQPGGELEVYDGLEFDVMNFRPTSTNRGRRRFDTDGDGVADDGYRDGVNVYGIGVLDFARRLRKRLGDDVLILGDGGADDTHQRCFSLFNGIESEWWPQWNDTDITYWSNGVNAHRFWQANAADPHFSYFVHKIGGHDRRAWNAVPYTTHRLILAAAQFLDAAVTQFFPIPPEPGEEVGVFDELRNGRDRQLNYLGQPLGPAVSLALAAPDRFHGGGKDFSHGFLTRIQGKDVEVSQQGDAVRIATSDPDATSLKFTIWSGDVENEDLTVNFTARAAPWTGYPAEVARRMTVTVSTGATPKSNAAFVNTRPFAPRLFFRNVQGPRVGLRFEVEGPEPIWLSGITTHAHADATCRLFENGLVLANPSDAPYDFDLSEIAPGVRFRRLHGSSQQDPGTNNGQLAGDTVTLAARDGLFLVKVDAGRRSKPRGPATGGGALRSPKTLTPIQ